jgi:hypothetical protein
VNKVPIGRYVAFVGSLLLAMLFIADWLLPMSPTQSVTSGEANKPIIRIKSDYRWPERIAFDTSAPTIVAQTPPVVADAPVTHPPREAFALLSAPVSEVSETRLPVRTKRIGRRNGSVNREKPVRDALKDRRNPRYTSIELPTSG